MITRKVITRKVITRKVISDAGDGFLNIESPALPTG
jgi:hypothetical protein